VTHIQSWSVVSAAALVAVFSIAAIGAADGATFCVDQKGKKGCFPAIQPAVSAAETSPDPTNIVNVGHGTYREQVIIRKSGISLIGANAANVIVDASGNANGVGIHVDGLDSVTPQIVAAGGAGITEVVVQGFTVTNARFEGILVTNASNITVAENHVTGNNSGLIAGGGVNGCPGTPSWETSEGFDCGEGIHLNAVHHSTVVDNIVEHNAGGILLTDETGPTHHVTITGNLVTENQYECGITLASHRPAAGFGLNPPDPTFGPNPYGVYSNTVSSNEASKNGLAIPGTGVGIGLFTSPGHSHTATYSNVIVGNRAVNNGHPGIALHSHRPTHNLTDNQIIGNYIAGNGADTALLPLDVDPSPSAPTGIDVFGRSSLTGTVIAGNVIEREGIDVAVDTPAQIEVHYNDLLGGAIGVATYGSQASSVNATQNWWGCPAGPGAPGCSSYQGNVTVGSWLSRRANPGSGAAK